MELIFQTSDDDDGINQFTMEISNSDSVPEIKRKIQELKGFPVSSQTLRFNGAVLADDFSLRHSQIVDGSTINLHLRQHSDLNTQPPAEVPSSSSRSLISPGQSSTGANISDQSGQQTDTDEAGNQPPITIGSGVERQNGSASSGRAGKRAREDIAEASGNAMSGGRDVRPRTRIRFPSSPHLLIVAVIYGEQRTMMVVRPEEPVSAVRAWLQHIQWRLPPRYDLTLHHVVMDENQSFAFNQVQPVGDVIRPAPRIP